MNVRWAMSLGVALSLGALASEARALLTIDEAKALAAKTGRPILAVAGDKT